MARYIDADKKIEEMNMRIESTTRLIENRPYDEEAKLILREHKFCLKELERTPTADVVEVVRCKDCIYAFMTLDREQVKYCDMFDSDDGVFFDKNHYCSYGERKELK